MKSNSRRDFLQSAVATVAGLSALTTFAACGESDPAPAPEAKPEPKVEAKPAPEPKPQPKPEAAPTGEAAKVDPNDALAQQLKYVEDAATVDKAANPMFKEGSHCANCALYTGAEGGEWGPCTLFGGKQVKASGWCASWAPKAG